MAIKDYTQNPRSDGYRGYRVYHSVAGKLIQKYFRPDHYEEAKMWSDYLEQKHDHRRAGTAIRHSVQYAYSAPRYDPPRRTAVVGITMGFNAQVKCDPVRHYPCFFFNCHSKAKGQKQTGSRMITAKRDLKATWQEVCETLAKWRGYKQVPVYWLDNCPEVEDFEKLRLWYCEHGTQIAQFNMKIFTDGVRA